MADDSEESVEFKRNREANIATVAAIVIIGFSFVIEAFPVLNIIAWVIVGILVLWMVWLLWLQGAIIDWQTDRDMRRPITMDEVTHTTAQPARRARE